MAKRKTQLDQAIENMQDEIDSLERDYRDRLAVLRAAVDRMQKQREEMTRTRKVKDLDVVERTIPA